MHSFLHEVKGLIKKTVLDLKDTNVALIGSDIDKKCRLEASNGEPAWNSAGKKSGVEVWRVNKFKLESVPENEIGSFYEGDSYIVLHTIQTGNSFKWDIYFWLGKYTTQDEAGTAAYKTVELDDHLGTLPIQHREVQEHESPEFLDLFSKKGGVRILKGGYDTGFHHVEPVKYEPRLMHIRGTTVKNMRVTEVELTAQSLNSSDCFVLDAGLDIYQFNGKKAKPVERNRASQVSASIQKERGKASIHVSEEGDADLEPFWKFFGGKQAIAEDGYFEPISRAVPADLYEIESHSGKSHFSKLCSGIVSRSQLKSNQVYLIDIGEEVFIWVGTGAPVEGRKYALQHALDFVNSHDLPAYTSLTRVPEGLESQIPSFVEVLAA